MLEEVGFPLSLPEEPFIELTAFADTSLTAQFMPHLQGGAWAVINEINYHSADDFDPGDWVEFHNPGELDLDMGGWQFKDSETVGVNFGFRDYFHGAGRDLAPEAAGDVRPLAMAHRRSAA